MSNEFRDRPLSFSIPLSLLIFISAMSGLLFKETYAAESALAVSQAVAQDWIDLIVVIPLLLISSIFLRRNNRAAFVIWFGAMIYVVYIFSIVTLGLHFNEVFLLYCITLGLSFYTIVTVLAEIGLGTMKDWFDPKKSNNVIMTFLWVIALIFFSQWIKQATAALIRDDFRDPESLRSAVHVLDLAIYLPGMAIASALLRNRHPLGYVFAPALVVFIILNGIVMAATVISMDSFDLPVNLSSIWLFIGIALASAAVLSDFLTHLTPPLEATV